MTNPFAQQPAAQQPVEQAQQAPAAGNPFAQNVPAAPAQQAPQYGATAGGQVAPGWLAAPGAPAPQQQAPQYAPQQQAPQYAPQQHAPQQAAPPAINMAGLQSVAPPPPSGDGKGAKLAHMYGRLVLVFPLGISRVPRTAKYVTAEQRQRGDLEQDRMTATVIVLDDGRSGMTPISFGGDPTAFPPLPDTESAPLPYVRKGMWINQSRVIAQLRDFLPQQGGAPGMVCGRVLKTGPASNDPWYLQGATEQDLALAGQYLQLVQAGTYPHPLAN